MTDDVVETESLVLFWTTPSPFCQWTRSVFTVDNVTYNCTEQWMMAEKARLFNDQYALAEIMRATDPRKQKGLGRKVRGFRENVWVAHRFHIVVRGNMAKFGQNEALKATLLATGKKTLVEASPYDRIWGIGLSPENELAKNPDNWEGQNLLGQALMVVRDHFNMN